MKQGYHHGNLRQALVEAALGLIAEKGPTGTDPVGPFRACRAQPSAGSSVRLTELMQYRRSVGVP